MAVKLHIDLGKGVFDVEGEESFVRSIYGDFKQILTDKFNNLDLGDTREQNTESSNKGNKTVMPKKKEKNETPKKPRGKGKKTEYKPEFNSDLDLKDLSAFYEEYETKKQPEQVLVFAMFLRDKLKIEPISIDDIYIHVISHLRIKLKYQ